MRKFDTILGYKAIKTELLQIADVLKNGEVYEKLGISAPHGLLLYGDPGVGKSLMASALIEEIGRKTFVCRKDKPNGEFVKVIKKTFEEAAKNAPSVVLLDDMDKFANGDSQHPDAEEYVTVQSCIDESKDKQVFVIATVNNIRNLPPSLRRAGRFDKRIRVDNPCGKDAVEITEHYLKNKKVVKSVDAATIARIMDGRSCAELETIINEAGIYAGYERCEFINMSHVLNACINTIFHCPIDTDGEQSNFVSVLSDPNSTIAQIIYHEAGHAVVSEVLRPESVSLVYAYDTDNKRGGFVNYYTDRSRPPMYESKSQVLTTLGGIAAVEQRFGIFDLGGESDLFSIYDTVNALIGDKGMAGLHLVNRGNLWEHSSERLRASQEDAVSAEVDALYRKAKEILSLNREFLEKVALRLAEKKILCTSDIQEIKSQCKIVPVAL